MWCPCHFRIRSATENSYFSISPQQRKEVHIEVEEYVLPKFEVTVEASKHYSLHDENIQVIVRGKYTHGNPVRGKAVVSVLEDDQYGCFFIRQDATKQKSLLEKTVDVDGSRTVELSIAELKLSFGDGMFNRYKEFKIQAEMTEELTGCSQSAKSITVQVHRDRYEIKSNFLELTMKPEHKVTAKVSMSPLAGRPMFHDTFLLNFLLLLHR